MNEQFTVSDVKQWFDTVERELSDTIRQVQDMKARLARAGISGLPETHSEMAYDEHYVRPRA